MSIDKWWVILRENSGIIVGWAIWDCSAYSALEQMHHGTATIKMLKTKCDCYSLTPEQYDLVLYTHVKQFVRNILTRAVLTSPEQFERDSFSLICRCYSYTIIYMILEYELGFGVKPQTISKQWFSNITKYNGCFFTVESDHMVF